MKSLAVPALTLGLWLVAAVGDDQRPGQAMPTGVGQGRSSKAVPDSPEPPPALQSARLLQQLRVQQLFEADDAPQALACLARMLRSDPHNQPAADRLMAAMSQRSFVLPIAKALYPNEAVQALEYSDDGQLLATTDENVSLRL